MRMSVTAFRYMHDAWKKGELKLDFEVPEDNPFRRPAKVISDAAE